MPSYNVEQDPVYKQLLKEHDHAFREHRRALTELRRVYLNCETPVDPIRAALLQHLASEAAHNLAETSRLLSNYAWELVPHSKDQKHLEHVARVKAETVARIEADEASKTKKSSIIVNFNGRVREFFIE